MRNATCLEVKAEIWLDDLPVHSPKEDKSGHEVIDFHRYEGSVDE